jgi:hypothetical protein
MLSKTPDKDLSSSLFLIPGDFSFIGYLRPKILPDTGVRQYADNFSQIQQVDTCVILPGRSIDAI